MNFGTRKFQLEQQPYARNLLRVLDDALNPTPDAKDQPRDKEKLKDR
jgi:hypothetical protein